MDRSSTQAEQAARKATRSRPIRLLGRVGLIAYGLVHFLVGYLAIRIAMGESGSGEKTDKGGALQALTGTPVGGALLQALLRVRRPLSPGLTWG
jgi:hypothetical protein